MQRSINNKLAHLDINSIQNLVAAAQPSPLSQDYFHYSKKCITKSHDCQALQIIKTSMNLLFKGGFAVEDSKFSPQFEVFDKVCVENCMD